MKISTIMLALSIVAFSSNLATSQGSPTGRWAGSISINEIALDIFIDLSLESESWTGSIDIPQQGAKGLPLQNITYADSTIHFELVAGPGLAVFDGQYRSDEISGTFSQAAYKGSFSLVRTVEEEEQVADPSLGEEFVLPLEVGQLAGSLVVADSVSHSSVIVFIPGSGPTDRDGNTIGAGKNNSLKMLAKALRGHGISSLRIDKRGLAGSVSAAVNEEDLRFSHYIEDIEAWCERLNQDDRFSKIYIAGHSEGSLVGLMSASQCGAAGFISLAGMGRSMGELLREQLSAQLPKNLLDESLGIIEALEKGEEVGEVSKVLASLFRPSVQPYLSSVVSIDPASEISKLEIPSLIIQGTTDIQVKVKDAESLHKAASNSNLKIIEGMNHILKMVDGDLAQQLPSYTDPTLPISKELVDEIVTFVSNR